MKKLYFGDCLDILKEQADAHPDGFIDLIYIDPPFNSKRDYNVLFESIDLDDANAQKQAFADTWSNVSYLDTLNEIQSLDLDLWKFLKTLDDVRLPKSAIAYLTTMAIRIYYMHKVMKETGSFYLHCDPTMSHYLKLVCDLIFGGEYFRNEIVWKRTGAHSDSKTCGNTHDVILFYTKSDKFTWNKAYQAYDPEYVDSHYRKVDKKGRKYRTDNLTAMGLSGGGYTYDWKGVKKLWRLPINKMEQLDAAGRIHYTRTGGAEYIRYLDEMPGMPLQDVWTDISPINSQAQERLGYPTQKPESLLERIVNTSSNEGDLVVDYFCGCGTTIAAAEHLNRNWIGVDISHLAVKLIVKRLSDPHRKNKAKFKEIIDSIDITGLPRDVASAKELARNTKGGRFGFQEWAIEVMMGGVCNTKKVADGGYDGYQTFNISEKDKAIILIEAKSGGVNVKNLREFIQVVKSKNAAIGAFVCFADEVTKPMLLEAKKEGYYDQKIWGDAFDKIQIITVEDLFEGNLVKHPESSITTFKAAIKKRKGGKNTQVEIF